MRPLGVGVCAAIVLAGPPLYSLVQAGSISGTTALTRGLVVAGVCAIGASFLNTIIEDFQREARARAQGRIVHHPGGDVTTPPGAPGSALTGPPGARAAGSAGSLPAGPGQLGFGGTGAVPVQGSPGTPATIAGQVVPRSG